MFAHSSGATEITLSLILAVRAGSELLLAFHTPRLVTCSGHVELLCAGLVVYGLRFLCYALVTDPWMVLPVEVLHGGLRQSSRSRKIIVNLRSNTSPSVA